MLVNNFNLKKVVDYLNTGKYKKVLLIMNHGLGDAVMFYATCYKTLCEKYPQINFYFDTHLGQEQIFGHIDKNHNNYDIAFKFNFPCSEWGNIDETKSEKCGRVEIGLKLNEENYTLPQTFSSPLVGVHFNSTSCPKMNVPEDFAEKLWNQIEATGFIPIDTHMRHKTDNKIKSIVHNFEQCRRVDNIPATTPKLLGLLSSCCGFAGIPSGNMPCALSIIPPEKILYITSEFPANRLTRLPVHEINWEKGYDEKIVNDWLRCLKK